MTITERFNIIHLKKVKPHEIIGFDVILSVNVNTTDIEIVFHHFNVPKVTFIQRLFGTRWKEIGNGILMDKKTFNVASINFTVPHQHGYSKLHNKLNSYIDTIESKVCLDVNNGIQTIKVLKENKDKIAETAMKYIMRYW